MITIAPKSSIIAKQLKNLNEIRNFFPNKDKTFSEKAISVAEGIAHQ